MMRHASSVMKKLGERQELQRSGVRLFSQVLSMDVEETKDASERTDEIKQDGTYPHESAGCKGLCECMTGLSGKKKRKKKKLSS